MTNSKKLRLWGLGLIVLSFVSLPLTQAIRECLIGNFNGWFSLLLFLILFISGYFYFIRGLDNRKTRLVVIIISILLLLFLTFVVITSLGSARTKAREAGVRAVISGMRAEAELKAMYDKGTDSYYYPDDICDQDSGTLSQQFGFIKNNGVNPICLTDLSLKSWAVSSELPPSGPMRTTSFCQSPLFPSTEKGSGRFYCVDSTGFSGNVTGNITGPSCANKI
ncbi:MAG: hypothetical protein V1704_02595 [Candidatus Vogelbacteria bacterium]